MKKKITLIDILIVVFVVLCIAILGVKLLGKSSAQNQKTIRYTVLVSNQSAAVADKIETSDKVLLDTKEKVYGSVVDVDTKDAEIITNNVAEGKKVLSQSSMSKDITLTIEAKVSDNQWGYSIGKQKIRIGEKQPITSKTYAITGYITDITEID